VVGKYTGNDCGVYAKKSYNNDFAAKNKANDLLVCGGALALGGEFLPVGIDVA
jgi:hypothetical protein